MINKEKIKKIILERMKENPNYLNEQAEAYDTEYALQKTFNIEFFPKDKIGTVKEIRDYLFELNEEFNKNTERLKGGKNG